MARAGIEGLEGVVKAIHRAVEKEVAAVEDTIYRTARANTPVLTGNAKRNWNKKSDPRGFTVENHVPYIERLDKGYSKKKPKGMVGPTLSEISRRK